MITTLQGDCRALLPTLPTASVQCIVTSPPYWRLRRYTDDPAEIGQEDAPAAYVEALRAVFAECRRVLRDDGTLFYNHKPRVQNGECILPSRYIPDGCILRQEVIWRRAGGVNMALTHYMPTHERILIIAKPGWRLKSKGASGIGDVWNVAQEPNTWHPAPFPRALVGRILETCRRPSLVLDPFFGSGTVGHVCQEWGVPWLGIEKSPAYAARAQREIDAAAGRDRTPAAELGPLFKEDA